MKQPKEKKIQMKSSQVKFFLKIVQFVIGYVKMILSNTRDRISDATNSQLSQRAQVRKWKIELLQLNSFQGKQFKRVVITISRISARTRRKTKPTRSSDVTEPIYNKVCGLRRATHHRPGQFSRQDIIEQSGL